MTSLVVLGCNIRVQIMERLDDLLALAYFGRQVRSHCSMFPLSFLKYCAHLLEVGETRIYSQKLPQIVLKVHVLLLNSGCYRQFQLTWM